MNVTKEWCIWPILNTGFLNAWLLHRVRCLPLDRRSGSLRLVSPCDRTLGFALRSTLWIQYLGAEHEQKYSRTNGRKVRES